MLAVVASSNLRIGSWLLIVMSTVPTFRNSVSVIHPIYVSSFWGDATSGTSVYTMQIVNPKSLPNSLATNQSPLALLTPPLILEGGRWNRTHPDKAMLTLLAPKAPPTGLPYLLSLHNLEDVQLSLVHIPITLE